MKIDYKKDFKEFYLPPSSPVGIQVPAMKFFMLDGAGDPNGADFSEAVSALYSLSYTIKMMPKGGFTPAGYEEYTVFPLEGVWDFDAKYFALLDSLDKKQGGPAGQEPSAPVAIDKSRLIYTVMIRQPEFVDQALAQRALATALGKKPGEGVARALGRVRFESFEEGLCVQTMHIGPYDEEYRTFGLMSQYCDAVGFVRIGHTHREIYLSDPLRTAPEKLKTALRWRVAAR